MEITLFIRGQKLEAHYPPLYSGSVGVLYARFAEIDFDKTLVKAVRFKTADSDWYTADIADGAVRVPHEVIVSGGFDIAIAGYENEDGKLARFLPTNSVHINVEENGYGDPDAPIESEGDPASYTAKIEKLTSDAAAKADAAMAELEKKANAAEVYDKDTADALLGGKVDKVSGKGLSANDYTDEEKAKLAAKADLSFVKKLIPKATVRGKCVTVTDHAEGVPLADLKIYGNCIQDTVPAPQSPVKLQSVGELVTDKTSGHYGKYDIPIKMCGKNLFDKNNCKYLIGYFTRAVTTITTHANARTIYIPCKADTKYTISRNTEYSQFHFGYTKELPRVGVQVFGAVSADSVYNKKITVATGSGAKYLVAYMYNGYSSEGVDPDGWTEILDSLQIEYGETATEYCSGTTYEEHIYTAAPLLKVGEVADCINSSDAKIDRRVRCIDIDSTASMQIVQHQGKNSISITGLLHNINPNLPLACTHSSNTASYDENAVYDNGTICIDAPTNAIIWVGILDLLEIGSIEEFKAFLDNTQIPMKLICGMGNIESEAVNIPAVRTIQSDTMNVTIDTTVSADIELTYYRDIGKKLAELSA